MTREKAQTPLSMRHILHTWWPLAASWLLMAAENPATNAVVARLSDPEINLAAWGGIVIPIALIVEAPIIMLLSASTALSKDWDSHFRLRRFMMRTGALLTALHLLIAATPLYYIVTVNLIGAPAKIIEPARWGLVIMTPWTWAIAYRRFNQGLLIRFGHSRAVGTGTLVRLGADGAVLAIGYLVNKGAALSIFGGPVSGIIVASAAITTGVVCEAIYAELRARPVRCTQLRQAPPAEQPLTFHSFLEFYTPLAMTSLLSMVVQPIGSAALSRMPNAISSLAAWSVVSGFLFLLRSLGFAYNEVTITLLDEPRALHKLQRFATFLTILTTALLLVVVATPLAPFWFERVSALKPQLAAMARRGLWVALLMPGLTVLQKWYQGIVVHSRRTRGITEAVIIFLFVDSLILWLGVIWGQVNGMYVGLAAFGMGMLAQTIWLRRRSRPAIRALQ